MAHSTDSPTGLVKFDLAWRALAEAQSVNEFKQIRDVAHATEILVKAQKLGVEMVNNAVELKLRAERGAGKLLQKMKEDGLRDKGKGGDRKSQLRPATVKLADLGLDKTQAHRWQKAAEVPDKQFERYITRTKKDKGELSSAAVQDLIRKEDLDARHHEPVTPPPLPTGKFSLIYADPPWRYEHSKTDTRKIENQYPTLHLDEICQLGVAGIAHEDAILFLWATSPKLEEAIRVVNEWGFKYRTSLVWVKDRIGMGYYARHRHELLLVAKKGNMRAPEPQDRSDSVIEAARGTHSEKPKIVYEMLENMYPVNIATPTHVELFARAVARPGWAPGWGHLTEDAK